MGAAEEGTVSAGAGVAGVFVSGVELPWISFFDVEKEVGFPWLRAGAGEDAGGAEGVAVEPILLGEDVAGSEWFAGFEVDAFL